MSPKPKEKNKTVGLVPEREEKCPTEGDNGRD